MVRSSAFDNYALDYDKWFEIHEKEYMQELNAIRKFLPKEGKGVEIGAGTGRFSQPLGISLGVEPSMAMSSFALSRGVKIIAGVAESIPIIDGLYDYVLLVTTICFVDEPQLAFKEAYRILKPQGFIIIGFIDKSSKLGNKYEEKKSESKFYKDANFHSVEEIRNDLEIAGFSDMDFVQAILPGDNEEHYQNEIKKGYGEGSFVVVRAQKRGGA